MSFLNNEDRWIHRLRHQGRLVRILDWWSQYSAYVVFPVGTLLFGAALYFMFFEVL